MNLRAAPSSRWTRQPRLEAVLIVWLRLLFFAGLLCAFEPLLPWIADVVDAWTAPNVQIAALSDASFTFEEAANGVFRSDIRSLSLRGWADDTNCRRRSRLRLLENGVPLEPHASDDRIRTTPGVFRHWKNFVEFHPSSSVTVPSLTDFQLEIPLTTGLSKLLRHTQTQLVLQSVLWPIIALGAAILGLLAVVRSPVAEKLATGDHRMARALLVALTIARLALALAPHWNCVAIDPDSTTYIEGRATRSPLYPLFLDFWEPSNAPIESRAHFDDPRHRLVPAVQSIKVIWLASIGFFVWQLSGLISPWLLAPVVAWTILWESSFRDSSQFTLLDHVLTEPLNDSLTFLLLGLVAAYIRWPGWKNGIAVSLVAALLMICRPANLPVLLLFAFIGWFEWSRLEWRRAALRIGGFAFVVALLMPVERAANYWYHGQWKSPPLSGQCLASLALQFAEPRDVESIEDPQIRQALQRCIDIGSAIRTETFHTDGRSTDVNIYNIGLPAVRSVYGDSIDPITLDRVLGVIAKTLIYRHPDEYLQLVATNFAAYWRWTVQLPLLLTTAAAAVWFARTRDPALLFTALLGTMPFAVIAAYCCLAVPLGRYQSQFAFAEYGVPAFMLAVQIARISCRRHPVEPSATGVAEIGTRSLRG